MTTAALQNDDVAGSNIFSVFLTCFRTNDWQSLASWPEASNVYELSDFDSFSSVQNQLRDSVCDSKCP